MDCQACGEAQATYWRREIYRGSTQVSKRQDPEKSDERLGSEGCKRDGTGASGKGEAVDNAFGYGSGCSIGWTLGSVNICIGSHVLYIRR